MKENNLRKAKVNELNRILPMIINTMRKEQKILCVKDELSEKNARKRSSLSST